MAGEGIGISPRVADVTIARWQRHISNQTINSYRFLAELKKHGNIRYNESGGELRWPLKYRRTPLVSLSTLANVASFNLMLPVPKRRSMNDWLTVMSVTRSNTCCCRSTLAGNAYEVRTTLPHLPSLFLRKTLTVRAE